MGQWCHPDLGSKNPFFFFINLFIYLFLAALGLHFCVRAFSSCSERGPLFIAVRGPLTIAASLVAEHRLQTHRLSSCGSRATTPSCSAACGIFPDQGSNPCPLHWQADSQPLRHQGSPKESHFDEVIYLVDSLYEFGSVTVYILSLSLDNNSTHLHIKCI